MRVESLTFFRFVAAFIVVIFHFGIGTWFTKTFGRFVTAGPEMVSFFFVLSGFVMVLSQIKKENFSSYKYYYARIARILPIYLLGLIIMLPLKYNINPISNSVSLILNLTFTQSWISPYPLSFNSPAWSVSVEMFFYLTFPLILFYIKKAKPKPLNFLVVTLLIWAFTQFILINLLNSKFYLGFLTTSHDLIFYFPLSHFCSFLIGISTGYLFLKSSHWKNLFNNKLSNIMVILVMLLLYYSIVKEPFLKEYFKLNLPFGSSLYAPIFAIVILIVSSSNNIFTKIFTLKPLVFLGNISFAIYILHSPLHTIYKKLLTTYFKDFELTKTQDFLFFIFLLFIICTISYYLLEKPLQKIIMKNYSNVTKLNPNLYFGSPKKQVK